MQKDIKKRFSIINNAEAELSKNLSSTQSDIYVEIVKILDSFSTLSGNLIYDRQAINLINQAEQQIRIAINKSDYPERVKDYLLNFDKIREQNILVQKSLNKIDITSVGLTSLQQSAVQLTTNSLVGNGLDVNFIQPVKDALFQHVVAGASIADTEIALRNLIKGDETLGLFQRYVTQISRDSISQYDGLIQSRIMNEFDLDGYSYEGSIIHDSRAQCRRWVEMGEIKFEDLEAELNWAYSNGSGMIPNTTKDTFPINRGGYNCRHFATAIRILD